MRQKDDKNEHPLKTWFHPQVILINILQLQHYILRHDGDM